VKSKYFAFALALLSPIASHAATQVFDAYSISWNSENLQFDKLSTTSQITRRPTTPDFTSQDTVPTVVEFTWKNPITYSGVTQQNPIPLPTFDILAQDGWAITAVQYYFNGNLSATGDATQSAIANASISFDKPKTAADFESTSIYGGFQTKSGIWQLSGSAGRLIECNADGGCVGATHAVIDTSQSYRSDIGPDGGSTTFSFRPVYSNDTYAMQWVVVNVQRIQSTVPESSTSALLGIGLLALVSQVRRKKHKNIYPVILDDLV
jgi:hypothetical protein